MTVIGLLRHLPHQGQRHDQPRFHVPLEIGRDGLGEGTVADQDACLDVPVERIRGEVRGGDEDLLVVVDDGLGVEDGPWAIALVDGTWHMPTLRVSASSWYVRRRHLPSNSRSPGCSACHSRGRRSPLWIRTTMELGTSGSRRENAGVHGLALAGVGEGVGCHAGDEVVQDGLDLVEGDVTR